MSARGRPSFVPARAALVALLVLVPGRLRAQSPADAPRTRDAIPMAGRAIARLDVPIHDVVAAAPNGQMLAALQTRPRPVLWVIPDEGAPFPFREWWAAYLPRWAPSGNRIGFISAGGPPRVWTVEVDTATGRAVDPPRLLIRTVTTVFTFDPEGRRIALVPARATAHGVGEVRIVDWASRKERVLMTEPGLIYWLDWSPDGGWIYYGLAPAEGDAGAGHRVRRVRVADGTVVPVLPHVAAFLGLSPDGRRLLYRPLDDEASQGAPATGDAATVEVADLEGHVTARLRLPPGGTPRWAAASDALLQVRSGDEGDEIWAIPLPNDRTDADGR